MKKSNEKSVKISIIIPVYNEEIYIADTLTSLLNQSFKEFEVICVDDGSEDHTLDILKSISDKDNRITILSQENSGAGKARNNGLKYAKGKYVIFLDSDDLFEQDMLEKLYLKAEETKSEMILFDAGRFDDKTGKALDNGNCLKTQYLHGFETISVENIYGDIFKVISLAPWNKFLLKEYLLKNKIEFQNTKNSNDVFFSIMCLVKARNISVIDAKLAYYRTGNCYSLQGNKDEYPIEFIYAFEKSYSSIQVAEYETIKDGFFDLFIDHLIGNLKTVKLPESRYKILEALLNSTLYDETINALLSKKDNVSYKQLLSKIEFCKMQNNSMIINNEVKILKESDVSSPKLSIIIPVYNVESFISETLGSILRQTLKDTEVICVDDGSDDSSLNIVIGLTKDDNRVTVCSTRNYGPSSARNIGIDLAKGEYLYFIDSDDILAEDALEKLYGRCISENLDVLLFEADVFADRDYSGTYSFNYHRHCKYENVYTGKEIFSLMRSNRDYFQSPCLYIFKKSLLIDNNIRFINGIVHEDNAFSFLLLMNAKRTSAINESLYYRRVRNDSIMTKNISYKNVYGYYRCYESVYDYYINNKEDLSKTQRSEVYKYLETLLENSIDLYTKMPYENRDFELCMYDGYERFVFLVSNPAKNRITAWREKKELSEKYDECIKKIKEYESEGAHKNINVSLDKDSISGLSGADISYDKYISLLEANHRLNIELLATRMSLSCRIGLAITWLPRKIKGLLWK